MSLTQAVAFVWPARESTLIIAESVYGHRDGFILKIPIRTSVLPAFYPVISHRLPPPPSGYFHCFRYYRVQSIDQIGFLTLIRTSSSENIMGYHQGNPIIARITAPTPSLSSFSVDVSPLSHTA